VFQSKALTGRAIEGIFHSSGISALSAADRAKGFFGYLNFSEGEY
jgi:hypothetical protein